MVDKLNNSLEPIIINVFPKVANLIPDVGCTFYLVRAWEESF
jgi:hypothetical protein